MARIFKTLWELKKDGQSEDTLKAKGDRLRYPSKHADLDDPEAVKGYIARANFFGKKHLQWK